MFAQRRFIVLTNHIRLFIVQNTAMNNRVQSVIIVGILITLNMLHLNTISGMDDTIIETAKVAHNAGHARKLYKHDKDVWGI